MSRTSTVPPAAVAALRRTVTGPIAYPSDPAYEELVSGHNLAVRHRPVVVVVATGEADVTAAVDVARTHHLPIHVQATGHGALVPAEGGLLLLTHRMDRVLVDPTARTAMLGAGVTWGSLARAAHVHGLAAVTTSGAGIGVVGSLLGGGLGPQSRTHGLCSDHVVALRVAGADGFVHDVDAASDLAWALLGGRDGLGVVVGVTVRLDGTPEVWGGEAVLEEPSVALSAWRSWSADLPDSMSTSAVLTAQDGRQVLRVTACDTEPGSVHERLDRSPFASSGAEVRSGRCTAPEWLQTYGEGSAPAPTWRRGFLLRELPAEAEDGLLAATTPSAPVLDLEVRRLGGQLDAPSQHSADLGGATHLVALRGAPVPELFGSVVPAHARSLAAALEPWLAAGSLLNFHGVPDLDHPLDRCWTGPTRDLLAATRRAGDPAGVFTRNPELTGELR